MSLRYKLSELAEAEIDRAFDNLLGLSEAAALALAEELQRCIDPIRAQPRIGRERRNWSPGLRSRVVGKYVLIYRFDDELLEVVRFIHGSRDLDAIFED